jgi:hypothetical protein
MKLGLIELTGIRRIVINRRQFYVRVCPTNPKDDDRSWVQQTKFEMNSDFIRMVSDHQMMIRVRSYLRGRKFRTHRIFVSGDTINIVKRDVPLTYDESVNLRAV